VLIASCLPSNELTTRCNSAPVRTHSSDIPTSPHQHARRPTLLSSPLAQERTLPSRPTLAIVHR
jgi:hypothetical protein